MDALSGIAFPGRRQVTALFCDIVGSVSLMAGLGEEAMAEVLGAYYAICDQVIGSHGGHITDYLGDGVVAYFGYPAADEDDPANAVRAAIGLRTRLAGMALADGSALQIRIGVATGLVVIEGLKQGADAGRATLVGSAPNLAARLMAIAPPNGIVVEQVIRRIGRDLFRFRDMGEVALKGFADRIGVSEVLEAMPAAGRFDARHRGAAPPLVGRDREMQRLLACWADACDGSAGRTAFIHGEAGIGKSRLVKAIQEHVIACGWRSVVWHCAPRRSDTALHPVIDHLTQDAAIQPHDPIAIRREKLEALLARAGVTEAASRATLADLLGLAGASSPDLLGLAGASSPGLPLTPERRRELTFETLLTMMDQCRHGDPTLYVVEDLHWADSSTVTLLHRAIELGAGRPWLFVLTARPDFQPQWPASTEVLALALDRLEAADAEQICRALDGQARLPDPVLRDFIARCDGNPLFLEEVTRSVLEALVSQADPEPHVAIPETLQASLIARLDRLGPLRRVVSLAAVLGQSFDVDMLAAVTGHTVPDLTPALSELVDSGLISEDGPAPLTHFRFKHAMIRDAAYDTLLKRERERLHGIVVTVLEERTGDARAIEPERLAYHLRESGAVAESIPLWAEAAQRAASRAAHREAAAHLSSALRLLAGLPPDPTRSRMKLDLLLAMAASLAALHGYSAPEVENAVSQARLLSDALGDAADRLAVMAACYSFSIVAGDLRAAEILAAACAEIANRSQKVRHQITTGSMQGFVLFARGEFGAARDRLELAAASYRARMPFHLPPNAIQDPLIVCLAVTPLMRHAMGDDDAAERAADELIAHARSLNRGYDLAYSLCWRALFEIARDRSDAALPLTLEAIALSDGHDFRLWKVVASLQCTFATPGQDAAGAVSTALVYMAELDRIGLNLMRSFYLWQIAKLHFANADTQAALACADRAIGFAESSGERVLLAPLYRCRADILERDEPTAARAARRRAVEIAREQVAVGFLRPDDAAYLARSEDSPATNRRHRSEIGSPNT